MREQRWEDDRANQLLDAARVILEAAGGWQGLEDDDDDDPARLLRFTELYFSEGMRLKVWPYVDQMNRGIEVGDLEDLRLGVLGLLNAWCELSDEDLSGRCPRFRVGLPPVPEGKGTDSSCSTWTPSSLYSTLRSTTSARPARQG